MPKTNTFPIRARLVSVIPDRTQFKQYMPQFHFDKLYVTIPVPTSEASMPLGAGGEITLTLEGFTAMLSNVADAIDKMHEEWQERYDREQVEKAKRLNQEANKGKGTKE